VLRELHIYDFDGTLFRSPDEPDWWPKNKLGSFFFHRASMGFPTVPKEPNGRWWVPEVVEKARRSIGNPAVYTIMATGRYDQVYGDRVLELLDQKGLEFDQVHCNPNERTKVFKRRLFLGVIADLPELERIEIWDDHKEYLQVYLDAFSDEHPDLDVSPTLVDVDPQQLPDTPANRAAIQAFLSAMKVAARYGTRSFG